MSNVKILLHIVFSTRMRKNTIPDEHSEKLYRFIWKMLNERKCILHRIYGTSNHLHMLINIHPTLSISKLMSEIKSQSSGFLKTEGSFPHFEGWGKEYFATSVSYNDKDAVVEYIKSQRIHHSKVDFFDEMNSLARNTGMDSCEFND